MGKLSIDALPEVLRDRLSAQFGAATLRSLERSFSEPRLPTLRANALKVTDELVMEAFRTAQIQFERIKLIPHAFRIRNRSDEDLLRDDLAMSGKTYLQGVASMLPSLVLAPKPGEEVLDMCAAPGSKTSQMAAMMEGKGRLVALEENAIRFQKLQNTMRMQGADFVEMRQEDATLIGREGEMSFDAVLLDAPCSAEGRIDLRDPRSYRFWSEKNIVAHAKLQRRLFRAAVRVLKPGGRLIYSTCTLAPEENEQMVDWALGEFPELRTEVIQLPVSAVKVHANRSVTVLPTVDHEGAFVVKFTKQENTR